MFPENTLTTPTWRSAEVFHSRAAAPGKARPPLAERRVHGTTSDDVDAERRRWRASSADDWWSSSARYGEAVWCRHLYTRTASLNLMRCSTFSQCNCVRSGVMRKIQAEQQNQHRLHPLGEIGWNANQRCITIVQPLQNDWRTERGTEQRILRSWRRIAKRQLLSLKRATSLPLPLHFLRGGWLHRWWLHPARRPQLGSIAQPQTNRYGYVNLFEAFANLKRVLKRSCLNASEDIIGAPILSSLIAILATQEPRKWSEVSLSSLQSGHKGSDRSFMIVRCLLRETCPVSSPVSRRESCFLRLSANLGKPGFGPLIYNLVCLHPGFCWQEICCSLRAHFRRFVGGWW